MEYKKAIKRFCFRTFTLCPPLRRQGKPIINLLQARWGETSAGLSDAKFFKSKSELHCACKASKTQIFHESAILWEQDTLQPPRLLFTCLNMLNTVYLITKMIVKLSYSSISSYPSMNLMQHCKIYIIITTVSKTIRSQVFRSDHSLTEGKEQTKHSQSAGKRKICFTLMEMHRTTKS